MNLGMARSKPAALPLGDIPTKEYAVNDASVKMVAKTGFEPVTPSL